MSEEADIQQMFLARERPGLRAAGFIIGGVVFFLGMGAFFVVLINRPARPGDDMMPGMMGGVSVIGVGLMARGIFLLRSTVGVVLDSAALHIDTTLSRKSIAWQEIDHLEQDKRSPLLGGDTQQVVRIIGKSGKPLASIADTIMDFDQLVAEIKARSTAAAGKVTLDTTLDEQRRIARDIKKTRRIAWIFALFTLGMFAGFCAGIYEEAHLRRYATEAVRVDATIDRRYMFRVTPHLKYTFQDPQGKSHTRDAILWQGPAWDALEGRSTVPVEYLRSDPEWNRLVEGEEPGPQFGGKMLLITGFGILMFGTFFILSFFGFDLRSEGGVTTLMRNGRVLRTWGAAKQ